MKTDKSPPLLSTACRKSTLRNCTQTGLQQKPVVNCTFSIEGSRVFYFQLSEIATLARSKHSYHGLNGWFGEMFVEGVGDLAFFSKTSADHLFTYLFIFVSIWNVWLPPIKFAMQFNLAMFVWPIFKIRQFSNVSLILFVVNKFHEVEILTMWLVEELNSWIAHCSTNLLFHKAHVSHVYIAQNKFKNTLSSNYTQLQKLTCWKHIFEGMEPLDCPLQHKPSANEHTKNIITINKNKTCLYSQDKSMLWLWYTSSILMSGKLGANGKNPNLNFLKQKSKLILKVISNSNVLPGCNHLWLSKIVE